MRSLITIVPVFCWHCGGFIGSENDDRMALPSLLWGGGPRWQSAAPDLLCHISDRQWQRVPSWLVPLGACCGAARKHRCCLGAAKASDWCGRVWVLEDSSPEESGAWEVACSSPNHQLKVTTISACKYASNCSSHYKETQLDPLFGSYGDSAGRFGARRIRTTLLGDAALLAMGAQGSQLIILLVLAMLSKQPHNPTLTWPFHEQSTSPLFPLQPSRPFNPPFPLACPPQISFSPICPLPQQDNEKWDQMPEKCVHLLIAWGHKGGW